MSRRFDPVQPANLASFVARQFRVWPNDKNIDWGDPDVSRHYLRQCKGYSEYVIRAAFDFLVDTCEWAPKPAQVREAIQSVLKEQGVGSDPRKWTEHEWFWASLRWVQNPKSWNEDLIGPTPDCDATLIPDGAFDKFVMLLRYVKTDTYPPNGIGLSFSFNLARQVPEQRKAEVLKLFEGVLEDE